MTQPIEATRKAGARTDRCESGSAVPAGGGGCIDIASQCVISGEIVVYRLQCRYVVDHCVLSRRSIRTQLPAEAVTAGKIDRGVNIDGGGVACGNRTLS